MIRLTFLCAGLILAAWSSSVRAQENAAPHGIAINPAEAKLAGNFEQVQLVVTTKDASGAVHDRSGDLTGSATFASSDPAIVTVSPQGRLIAKGNGQTTIKVSAGGATQELPVTVSGVVEQPQPEFLRDIEPILGKTGCNMGPCHAVQHGQAGFKLSVFGFDPDADRNAIVRDRLQRRMNVVAPEQSLFLLKPTMQVPHGGGKRLAPGSVEHQTLVAWIKAGAPAPSKDALKVTGVEVFPKQRVGQIGLKQQLRVEATYSDGSKRDVTGLARFDSMDDGMLAVTNDGFVTTSSAGQASVMARFEGQATICMFVIPYRQDFQLSGWTNNNFVDELASQKFKELGIEPSPLCDDATFIRRAFLDVTGTLPTVDQTKKFLASTDPKKREQIIDELLGLTGDPSRDIHNDNYAAFWTLKWADLLRNTSNNRNADQGMWAMHNWLKDSFRTNKPLDGFVRELVMGKGSIYMNGPANYFRVFNNSSDLAEATAQIFLGVRLECAKCHHHPFEKYGQEDYYAFAAFFSRVANKNSEEFGMFGREQVVIVRSSGEVSHPKTGKRMTPTPLDGQPADHPLDRRIGLADWLANKDNKLFANNIANRYVRYLLGRGLVEPVDDLRSTNPPTNPALMDALSKHFVDSGFNPKQLIRAIMVSRLYQLDSQPTVNNQADLRFYSHYFVKRISAEPLLDAIDQVTDSRTKHNNLPLGTRAIELPDAEYPNYFLNTFAKPRRVSVCECERAPDENLTQALHTLNGDTLASKLSDKKGRIAKLIAAKTGGDDIINELYLAALCRAPRPEELTAAQEIVSQAASPQEGYEDVLWALMNSKYFLFVH